MEPIDKFLKENLRDDIISIISNNNIDIDLKTLRRIKLSLVSGDSDVAQKFMKLKNINEDQYDLFIKKFEKDDNYAILSELLGRGWLIDGKQIFVNDGQKLYDKIISQCKFVKNEDGNPVQFTKNFLESIASLRIQNKHINIGSYEMLISCFVNGCSMINGKGHGDIKYNNDIYEVKCDEWTPVSTDSPNTENVLNKLFELVGADSNTIVKYKTQFKEFYNEYKEKIIVKDVLEQSFSLFYKNYDKDLLGDYINFLLNSDLQYDDFLKSLTFWGVLQYKLNCGFTKLFVARSLHDSKYRILDKFDIDYKTFWNNYNELFNVTTGLDKGAFYLFPKIQLK